MSRLIYVYHLCILFKSFDIDRLITIPSLLNKLLKWDYFNEWWWIRNILQLFGSQCYLKFKLHLYNVGLLTHQSSFVLCIHHTVPYEFIIGCDFGWETLSHNVALYLLVYSCIRTLTAPYKILFIVSQYHWKHTHLCQYTQKYNFMF